MVSGWFSGSNPSSRNLSNHTNRMSANKKCLSSHNTHRPSHNTPQRSHASGPSIFSKIGDLFESKPEPKVKTKTPQETKTKTPPERKNEQMSPLKALAAKLDIKNTFEPKLPVAEKKDKAELETYKNSLNSHTGFKFEKNKNGEQQMDIKGNNVSEAVSTGAFNLMHNDETSVELTKKDFGKMFSDLRPTNEQSDKPLTKEEFQNFHTAYAKNASGQLGEMQAGQRDKEQTVDMDATDKEHINNLFSSIAGEDELMTKKEYTDFQSGMFGKYASGKDGQDTKLTRAEQDKYIEEMNEKKEL